MFSFFAGYTPAGVQMMTDIDKYLSFVLAMFLAFGLTFEVPVVVIVLVRMRVVSLEKLRVDPLLRDRRRVRHRRDLHAARRAVAADARVPLWLLYELGLLLARVPSAVPARDESERRQQRRPTGRASDDRVASRLLRRAAAACRPSTLQLDVLRGRAAP